MPDSKAVIVAADFYKHLRGIDENFEVAEGAVALHRTIRQLMQLRGTELMIWAEYIHIGF